MRKGLRCILYNSVCASISLTIASYAMLPAMAATTSATGYRGGQISCPTGGCHDQDSHCSGNSSCRASSATACLQGNNDTNGHRCGTDSGLCSDQGCGGVDAICGGH
jgi:hypothetical protein